MRHSAPGFSTRARSGSNAGCTKRRLAWRAFGQGSGNSRNSRSRQASGRARISVRASSSQMRRLPGSGAVASPPSGTSRDSSEHSPLTNTSQAISPASGCAAAWASACSPPPNPTSSHSSAGRGAKADERIGRARRRRSAGAAALRPAGVPGAAAARGRGRGRTAGPAAASAAARLRRSAPERGFQRRHQIGLFPGEGAQLGIRLAAEMAVGRGRHVDRPVQVQVLADAARRQVHQLAQRLLQLRPRSRRTGCRAARHRPTAGATRRSHS